jgi:hypothetical protein
MTSGTVIGHHHTGPRPKTTRSHAYDKAMVPSPWQATPALVNEWDRASGTDRFLVAVNYMRLQSAAQRY